MTLSSKKANECPYCHSDNIDIDKISSELCEIVIEQSINFDAFCFNCEKSFQIIWECNFTEIQYEKIRKVA